MEGMPPPRRLKSSDLQRRASLRHRHSNYGNVPTGSVADGLRLAEGYERIRDQMADLVRIQSEVSSPIKLRAIQREYDNLEHRLNTLYDEILNEANAGRNEALELLAEAQDQLNSTFSADYEYADQLAADNLRPTFNRYRSDLNRIRDSHG